MTKDTTPTSGAADLPEALRRSTAADGKTELFNLPGYPLMVRAVDFNRIHTESEMRIAALLDEMQKSALAAGQATAAPAEPDPTPGDHPPPCDSELFESGVSVGLFDIPKWTAEALCKGIAAATGARVDWHYIGGRVHVKALPAPTSAEGVAYAALPTSSYAGRVYEEGFLIGTCPLYTADQLHAFADAPHALRASHGQAPAGVLHLVNSAFAEIAMAFRKAFALHKVGIADKAVLKALAAPAGAQADRVQEDAAREAIEKVLALFPFKAPIQKFTVNNGPCLTADNDDEFYSVKRVLAFLTEIKTTLDAPRKQGATQ